MKPFSRADRVSGQIKKILSDVLQKKIKDPRLKTVTITAVKLSRDLRFARIYFTTSLGSKDREAVDEGFKSALGYVKRTLAEELGLRYMPDLKFFYDQVFEHGVRIDNLLKSIKIENGSNHTSFEK